MGGAPRAVQLYRTIRTIASITQSEQSRTTIGDSPSIGSPTRPSCGILPATHHGAYGPCGGGGRSASHHPAGQQSSGCLPARRRPVILSGKSQGKVPRTRCRCTRLLPHDESRASGRDTAASRLACPGAWVSRWPLCRLVQQTPPAKRTVVAEPLLFVPSRRVPPGPGAGLRGSQPAAGGHGAQRPGVRVVEREGSRCWARHVWRLPR